MNSPRRDFRPPTERSLLSRRRARASVTFLLAFIAGCGGGSKDGGTTGPPTGGGFSIAASATSLSIAQSANGALTLTVTRTGGFTGAVSLAASGLANGVTASFNPQTIATGQTSTTITITAASTSPSGTTTFTVRASASGLTDQTVSVQLTITTPTQAGPFQLAISASSYLILPSNQLGWPPLITITRNPGFTGAVNFTVTGLPPTLFLGLTPNSTTGNTTSALALNIGTANGTYTATIHGTAAGLGEQTVTLQIVVASPTTGSIKWKFCSSTLPQYFFAVKDGAGAWTRVVPDVDTTYSFNIAQGTGSAAMVQLDSGGFRTTVYQMTAQEMAARAASQCLLYQNVTSRTANGSVGGVTGFRTSQIGMGWWFGSTNGNGTFSMLNLPPGPLDVVAVRNADFTQASAIPIDRGIIRRGTNPASGGTIPVLDFGAAESFAPTSATWTFGNTNGEQFGVTQMFTTNAGTTGMFYPVPGIDNTATIRTIYGIPLAQTIAGDLHQVVATVSSIGPVPGGPNRATRQIITYARTLTADRTLNFGPAMPAPTVTVVAGAPAGRLRAQGTLPTEYTSGVSFDITQTTTAKFATVQATRGFLGTGSGYDVQIPDLTGAVGWDTQFALRAGTATNWWVSGGGPTLDFFDGRYIFNTTRVRWTGAQTGVVAPADGATYLMARALGTTTP